LVTVRV
jgi:hypothetical protein